MRSRRHHPLWIERVIGVSGRFRPRVARRVSGLVVCILLVGAPAGASQPALPSPHVSMSVSDTLERKLEAAFELAYERVQDSPTCRALFSELGHDATEMLRRSRYVPANIMQEQRVCRRAVAFTGVGSPAVRLCRGFGRLALERAAMVVIHEALHTAGLPEWPLDPEAMTSAEINALVGRSCDL